MVHMPFRIRDYRDGDFPQVARLWSLAGLDDSARGDDATVIERTLAHGGFFLVVEGLTSSEVMGTSWVTQDGRRQYLHHFGVAPDHQGHGIGTALLRASLVRARTIGLQIKLEVHRANTAAVALYRRQGFTCLGDYDGYIIRDMNA